MGEERKYIIHDISSGGGGSEARKLYSVTNIKSGETEIVVEYTMVKRYPVQEFSHAEDIYEGLGGNRKIYDLEDIARSRL